MSTGVLELGHGHIAGDFCFFPTLFGLPKHWPANCSNLDQASLSFVIVAKTFLSMSVLAWATRKRIAFATLLILGPSNSVGSTAALFVISAECVV